MLILIGKIKANEEKDNLYAGITLSDEALHTSKGVLDYHINKLISKQMLLDVLKLQKKAFLSQYNKVDAIKNWYPPSNFWCEGMDSNIIHIGVDGTDCDILTLDGEGNPVNDTTPLGQVLVAYTEREGSVLSYLISEYNTEKKDYEIKRIQETDLIEKIDNGLAFSNAMTEFDEEGEEKIKQIGFGFTYEIDTKNAARLQKIKANKREAAKLTKNSTGLSHTTVLKEQFDSANENILEFLSADAAGACTKEQKEFLASYYSWYLKRAFELIIGNSRVNISVNKKAALDTLKISKDSQWEFKGCAYSNSQSIHCSDPSCNKGLKKAYVFTAESEDGEPMELYFGLNCAEAFFEINSNDLETMQESVSKAESEIKDLFAAAIDTQDYDGMSHIDYLIYQQQLFRDSIKDLKEKDALKNIYGEASDWLVGFIDNNLPIPDTLNTMIITTFVRRTKVVDENVNNKSEENNEKKEDTTNNSNLRKRVLNATIPDDVEFKEEEVSFYWGARTPEYSDVINYFPESKQYFDFMYKYKLFSMPLTGTAANNFDKKHSNELKHIAWAVNAQTFTADELANIILILKIEKSLSDIFTDLLHKEGINLEARDLDKIYILAKIRNNFRRKFPSRYSDYHAGIYRKMYENFTALTAILRPYMPEVEIPKEITQTGRKTTILVKSPKYRLLCPEYEDIAYNNKQGIKYSKDMPQNERKNYYVSKLDNIAENPKLLKEVLGYLQTNYQKYVDYLTSEDFKTFLHTTVKESRDIITQKLLREKKAREREEELSKIIEYQEDKKPITVSHEELLTYPLYERVHKDVEFTLMYNVNSDLFTATLHGNKLLAIRFSQNEFLRNNGMAVYLYDGAMWLNTYSKEGRSEVCKYLPAKKRYQMLECSIEVNEDTIHIKEKNDAIDILFKFNFETKKLLMVVTYGESETYAQEYDIRTEIEIEEDNKASQLKKLAELKSAEEVDSFKTANYPDTISDYIEIKKDDNLGLMITHMRSEIKAGNLTPNPDNAFVTKILDTLAGNLRLFGRTRCSHKQYGYVINLIKQVQHGNKEEIEKLEQETTVDLLEVYRNLAKQYGVKCIPTSYANQLRMSKATKYIELGTLKPTVCECICRFISRYNLDKSDKQYGYDLIPQQFRKDIKYLENDKELEDKFLEIFANLKNIRADSKSASILDTVLRKRYYSPAQFAYLKKLISDYEIYLQTRNVDDVDKDEE